MLSRAKKDVMIERCLRRKDTCQLKTLFDCCTKNLLKPIIIGFSYLTPYHILFHITSLYRPTVSVAFWFDHKSQTC